MNETSLLHQYPQSFVHLHLHTQYSLLDGALRLPDLFKKCQEYGMPAVASTDHGNMFGAIDFYQQALKAKVKPLLGSEIYFTPGSRFDRKSGRSQKSLDSQDENESKHHIHHLVLICKNLTGYRNLCQLLSKAYLEGFYYKPRVDIELLKQYSEGLIATTACLKGEVAFNLYTGLNERALEAVHKYREVFKEDFFLEIQENGLPEQKQVNQELIKFAQQYSIPLVATNDVHYLTKEDAAAQEVLLCVQTGKTFLDEKRMKLTTSEFYLKSPQEMRSAFHYFKEACDNTLLIADRCDLNFKWHDDQGKQIYHLPNFPIETEETLDHFFVRTSNEGLQSRFNGPHFKKIAADPQWEEVIKPEYQSRLDLELKMIAQMGFVGYFLIVADFINWAKQRDIPVGPGRGSGAGSLVAYALGITNINPIPYSLLFERFINPERVSLPDFDVDFCQERRQEVIDYVTNKYGHERVGQIITFGKLQAKAVIRDVSRVFGLPYVQADALAKLIPDELGITLHEAKEKEVKLVELIQQDQKIAKIFDISQRLEGLLRHASIHAAGVIITNEPLVHYCPLYRGREGEQVVQFDKDFSEKIGLVKFDFLGLKTLTVIQAAVKFIRRDHDPNFDIEQIDLEDRPVFEMISKGNTSGVFQLESPGMKDLCKRVKPDTIDDITAINALFRPGPLGSGMVDDFIEIKHGRKKMTFLFPELEPVLKDTYGIIVYQEQVMNTARVIASYSLGQADMLRRAMGKKKPEEMERHQSLFVEGARANGFDPQKAKELFDLMAMFAEYGFNKSHAVAYAFIAYQTAFLKCYYPAAFYSALLGTEMDNTDKIKLYINDAKDNGIELLPPDINESLYSFNKTSERTIRFGLGAVKNVGQNATEMMVKERQEHGPYLGFVDFCCRIDLGMANKRVLESLIKVGAFDQSDQLNRRTLLEQLDYIMGHAQRLKKAKESMQESFFSLMEGSPVQEQLELKFFEDYQDQEKLEYEAHLLGIYVSGHPLDRFASYIHQVADYPIEQIPLLKETGKKELVLCGMIGESKILVTKKGDKMAFATLEDKTGKIECIFFPKVFAQYQHFLESNQVVAVEGHVQCDESPRKFFPQQVFPVQDYQSRKNHVVKLHLKEASLTEESLIELKQLLLSHKGSSWVYLIIHHALGRARIPLGQEYQITVHQGLVQILESRLGNDAVEIITEDQLGKTLASPHLSVPPEQFTAGPNYSA